MEAVAVAELIVPEYRLVLKNPQNKPHHGKDAGPCEKRIVPGVNLLLPDAPPERPQASAGDVMEKPPPELVPIRRFTPRIAVLVQQPRRVRTRVGVDRVQKIRVKAAHSGSVILAPALTRPSVEISALLASRMRVHAERLP